MVSGVRFFFRWALALFRLRLSGRAISLNQPTPIAARSNFHRQPFSHPTIAIQKFSQLVSEKSGRKIPKMR
jgi:hypothetical protein